MVCETEEDEDDVALPAASIERSRPGPLPPPPPDEPPLPPFPLLRVLRRAADWLRLLPLEWIPPARPRLTPRDGRRPSAPPAEPPRGPNVGIRCSSTGTLTRQPHSRRCLSRAVSDMAPTIFI